jgi:hypothetical protein
MMISVPTPSFGLLYHHYSSISEVFLGGINKFAQPFQPYSSSRFFEVKRNIHIHPNFYAEYNNPKSIHIEP